MPLPVQLVEAYRLAWPKCVLSWSSVEFWLHLLLPNSGKRASYSHYGDRPLGKLSFVDFLGALVSGANIERRTH